MKKKNILVALNGDNTLDLKNFIKENNIDYLIGVDGGIRHYVENDITRLDLIIGDFDSYDKIEKIEYGIQKKLNPMKDETDFEAALSYIGEGEIEFNKIFVVGYHSTRRMEHFYANIILLNENVHFIDKDSEIFVLKPGRHIIKDKSLFHQDSKYISFFAKEDIEHLIVQGMKYMFDGQLLTNNIIGISNEFTTSQAIVSFKDGQLLCFVSND